MSKLTSRHIFTSESVSEGHPDKVCDQISDAILDAYMVKDPFVHVGCETAVGPNLVVNIGEISGRDVGGVDTQAVARAVVKDIGYDRPEEGFSYNSFNYVTALHAQSSDINQGVSRKTLETQGAGDQGMMFGYASNETEELMPAPLIYAHRLLMYFTALRKNGEISYLRPDSKSQVSMLYDHGVAQEIETVVISHQTEDVSIKRIRKDIEENARIVLKETGKLTNRTKFIINPTGRFVIGGPCGDSGVTGRKIIVDTYGGIGSHGGGAFSGKDPSKVDRSAAYYCRYVAKNIVAAGLVDKCEVQVAYAIGVAKPVSINVCTYGTGKVADEKITKVLLEGDVFDFRPGILIRDLGLTKPKGWSYRQTSNYGHFGREGFPWEKTDRVARLKSALGVK